jgi:hypothetical protein
VSQDVDSAAREDIRATLLVLREIGPRLGRPLVDTLKGSKLTNLKELRVQSKARPFRILFVFDPRRVAILLVGGNKQRDKRFYLRMIPLAEKIYEQYLKELPHDPKKPKS